MNSLKECLETEKQKSLSKLKKTIKSIKSALKEKDFKELLFLVTEFREVGNAAYATNETDFLIASNLLFMGEDIDSDTITYGADPEFILCDAEDEDKIVMYSSEYGAANTNEGEVAMSSLSIGADYGLLELRPSHSDKYTKLPDNIMSLVKTFEQRTKQKTGIPNIKIKEVEAVPFMHKIQRMREVMEKGDEIDYGGNRSKMGGVQAVSINDMAIAGAEYYGISLTAYDTPGFVVSTDKVLTAGGHLHFGGACIKMLSMAQLKALVRKLDDKLLPIAKEIETEAAQLRRKYYGLPGEFRLKPYGFEYRVLSCAPFWKKNNKVLTKILKEADRIITKFDF